MMITCQDIRNESPEYLDGDQSLLRRLGFRMHLLMCRACHAYVKQVATVRRMLGRLPVLNARTEAREETRRQFKASA